MGGHSAINRRFHRNGKGSSINVVPKQGRDGHSINAEVGIEGHRYADVRSPIYYTIHFLKFLCSHAAVFQHF